MSLPWRKRFPQGWETGSVSLEFQQEKVHSYSPAWKNLYRSLPGDGGFLGNIALTWEISVNGPKLIFLDLSIKILSSFLCALWVYLCGEQFLSVGAGGGGGISLKCPKEQVTHTLVSFLWFYFSGLLTMVGCLSECEVRGIKECRRCASGSRCQGLSCNLWGDSSSTGWRQWS